MGHLGLKASLLDDDSWLELLERLLSEYLPNFVFCLNPLL
jgi:hypothetical protein